REPPRNRSPRWAACSTVTCRVFRLPRLDFYLLPPTFYLLPPDTMSDTIIIGAGHNGLVTAFYLAKAGRKPLVLERRPVVGGGATTEEFAPGFKSSTLAHTLGPLRPAIVRDMQLERRGVTFVRPDPRLVSLGTDGRALVFSTDPGRTAEA